MNRVPASSPRAQATLALVEELQQHFTTALEALDAPFTRTEWLRDDGRHGGGARTGTAETDRYNRASVNVSCVHYDDEPARKLRSATALSTIIHPTHPRAPSVHIHLSYTELREGRGTWRLMADLNPSLENAAHRDRFASALAAAAPSLAAEARAQGDRYFFIPALGRHRGVTHFYVEDYASGDFDADLALARRVGLAAIDTYLALLKDTPTAPATGLERQQQLAYHTLYLFQVLTLDRGTTSGLLVHDQNDVGIMGSLPSFVDRQLLASWEPRMPKPQDELLRALVAALPGDRVSHVTDEVRATLAKVVRAHYRAHPAALELQASGNVIPPTVDNHR
ncbi:MAG: coproporphyrinogen III oxidase [Myxococcota bacterium]